MNDNKETRGEVTRLRNLERILLLTSDGQEMVISYLDGGICITVTSGGEIIIKPRAANRIIVYANCQ